MLTVFRIIAPLLLCSEPATALGLCFSLASASKSWSVSLLSSSDKSTSDIELFYLVSAVVSLI